MGISYLISGYLGGCLEAMCTRESPNIDNNRTPQYQQINVNYMDCKQKRECTGREEETMRTQDVCCCKCRNVFVPQGEIYQ